MSRIKTGWCIKLACTKIRAHKLSTLLVIAFNSIMFAAVIMVCIIFVATSSCMGAFIRDAGGDNYLVSIQPHYPSNELLAKYTNNPTYETIDEVREYEEKYVADKKAEYEELGIEYEMTSDQSALRKADWMSKAVPEQYRVTINMSSPVMKEIIDKEWVEWASTASNKTDDMLGVAREYGMVEYYKAGSSQYEVDTSSISLNSGNAVLIDGDGVESISDWLGQNYRSDGLAANSYTSFSKDLLKKYIGDIDESNIEGVPVIVSAYDVAELYGDVLGVAKQAPSNDKAKVEWLNEIKEKSVGFTYSICYRSSTERQMLYDAQASSVGTGSNDNGITYGFPTEACGDIPIVSDTRTEVQKADDATKIEQEKKTGDYVEPLHKIINFQIVGVINEQSVNDSEEVRSTGVVSEVASLLSERSGLNRFASSGIIVSELYDSLPDEVKIANIGSPSDEVYNGDIPESVAMEFSRGVLEFDTVEHAKAFLKNETCSYASNSCDKEYEAEQFGVNYLVMEEINDLFLKVMTAAIPCVLFLLIGVMFIAISRVMFNSRYETAIYRSIGANRFDIALIYIMYSAIVSALVLLVSAFISIVVAIVLEGVLATDITNSVRSILGIVGSSTMYHFFVWNSDTAIYVVGVSLAVVVTSCAASIIPIIRNTMRSPVADLREN